MRERFIIHLNVADFAVAIERLTDSRLRERPVIVAPQGAVRAVVYDMSEEAYQNGVRKQMPLGKALRRCRDACVVAPHVNRYENAMKALVRCAMSYSPLVEMADHNGHLFVDATGRNLSSTMPKKPTKRISSGKLFGPPPDVAWRIRKEVRSYIGVDPIWSVAPNKLVAKVATRLVKPTGEYIVGAGDEEQFLLPVSLYLIPGIKPNDLNVFYTLNLTRAGHVAAWSKDQLEVVFGKNGATLYNTVRGIDASPVAPVQQKKMKICADHEFADDTNDPEMVEGVLYRLAEQAGADLRQQRLMTKQTEIVLSYSDGKRTACRATAKPATADDFSLFKAAKFALTLAWTRRVRIRHLRLICNRLAYPPAQLDLFPNGREEAAGNLMAAVDAIRKRFGVSAVQTGRTLILSPS